MEDNMDNKGAVTKAAEIRKTDFFKMFRRIVSGCIRNATGEFPPAKVLTATLKAMIPNNLVIPTEFLQKAIAQATDLYPDEEWIDWFRDEQRACFTIGAIMGYCHPNFSMENFKLEAHVQRPAFKKGMSFGLQAWRTNLKGSF
jgi:hypothetical protein